VIRDVTNVLVELFPAPVVARISMTLSHRGVESLEREIAVATHLARAGAPIAPPSDDPPAGPHLADGFQISFWRLADHDSERPLDKPACGRALRRLHEALATYEGALPTYDRFGEIDELLTSLRPSAQAGEADLELLRKAHSQVVAQAKQLTVALRPLHGDAHFGNVLRTPSGPIWTDLENVCAGPVVFDLACLEWQFRALGPSYDAREALDAYGPFDAALLEQMIPVRALLATVWTIAIVSRMTDQPKPSPILAARLSWWRNQLGEGDQALR
jgi:Ser/Thr protein kinase RdoA (MazF antagonist)